VRNIVLLLVVILSGCSPLNFQYNTLNTAGQLDSIYGDVEIIETESDVRRKLARDFRFRLDLQRYWNTQPYGIVSQYYWSNDLWWYRYQSSYHMWTSYDWFDWWHPNWVRHHRYWYWYYPRPNGWYTWHHWSYSHYTEPLYSWYNGPFNNSGYNVIYNASRRGALTSISNRIQTNRINNVNKRPVVVDKPIVRFVPNQNKPSNNNTIRVKPNNNYVPKPNNNYNRPSNNNYSRPSNNNWSRPNNNINSKPSISRNVSRPTPTKRGGN